MSKLTLIAGSPAPKTKFAPTQVQEETIERIADHIDQIIKYAFIPREQILRFVEQKFRERRQPFPSLPTVDEQQLDPRSVEILRVHIILPIYRLEASERDKYALLVKLREEVRARMRPVLVSSR